MAQRLLSFLLLFLTTFMSYAGEEAITLVSRKGTIQGTLMLPDSLSKNQTIVLIIPGSGPTDRNGNQMGMTSNMYKMMADALAKEGIATLRYDKRGIGESKASGGAERDLRFEDYVQDVKDWIRMLAGDKRFGKVIVAGHSEGSLIGMLAAGEGDVAKAFISIAGPARPAHEVLREQLASQPKTVTDMVYPMLDTIQRGDTLRYVPQILNSLFRPSVQPYLISWFRYNPQAEIKKLNMPILLVQGGTDLQVSLKDAVLLAAVQPKAEKLVVPDMNHVLKQTSATTMQEQMPIYSNGELPLHPELVAGILGFGKGLK